MLSASVTGIQGIAGLEFSGSVEGIRIDIGKLLDGEFPIVGIDAIGVTITGNLFGGEVNATLLGGILRVSDAGAGHRHVRPHDARRRPRPLRRRRGRLHVRRGSAASDPLRDLRARPAGRADHGLGPGITARALRRPDARPTSPRASSSSRRCRRSTTRSSCAGRQFSAVTTDGRPPTEWLATIKTQVGAPVAAAAGQPGHERLRGRVHRPDDDHRQRPSSSRSTPPRPSSTAM